MSRQEPFSEISEIYHWISLTLGKMNISGHSQRREKEELTSTYEVHNVNTRKVRRKASELSIKYKILSKWKIYSQYTKGNATSFNYLTIFVFLISKKNLYVFYMQYGELVYRNIVGS